MVAGLKENSNIAYALAREMCRSEGGEVREGDGVFVGAVVVAVTVAVVPAVVTDVVVAVAVVSVAGVGALRSG